MNYKSLSLLLLSTSTIFAANLSVRVQGNNLGSFSVENAKNNLVNMVDVSTGIYYREREVLRPINGLLQHDLSAALNDIKSNPTPYSHSQATRDTFSAIKALPTTLPSTNAIETKMDSSLFYAQDNWSIGLISSLRMKMNIKLDKTFDKLIVYADAALMGTQYLEYKPEDDSYAASDQSTYESSSFLYAITEGKDYLDVTGVKLLEIPVGYTFDLDKLHLTVTPSFMYATSFSKGLNFLRVSTALSSDDSTGQLDALISDVQQINLAINLGFDMVYNVWDNLDVGIKASNITNPTFPTNITEKTVTYANRYLLNTMYHYDETLYASAFLDAVSTPTLIDNYAMQYVGMSVSSAPLDWFSANINIRQNFAHSSEGMIIGTTLALHTDTIVVNLSGEFSTNTTEVAGSSIPSYAQANLNVAAGW